jgi:hypothetical protein
MEIPKDQIVEFLQERGDSDQAAQADQELPAQVDTDQDAGLLSKCGIDPQELITSHGATRCSQERSCGSSHGGRRRSVGPGVPPLRLPADECNGKVAGASTHPDRSIS